MSETIQTTAPIVQTREIRASAERVFALLTEPEELVRWMPDVADLEPRVGGRIRFGYDGGRTVIVGTVTRFEPPRALAYSWTWEGDPESATSVEFTVDDLGDGRCRVEVVHSGWETAPDRRPPHEQGWAYFLGCLADLAEGRPVDKKFPA
jgi:uncharacterized protein YndB with AHSA1/START domain